MRPIDHLARRVYTLRRAYGMTQRALADAVGCNVTTIGHLENGKSRTISLDYLVVLARVLGTSVDALLGVTDEDVLPSR